MPLTRKVVKFCDYFRNIFGDLVIVLSEMMLILSPDRPPPHHKEGRPGGEHHVLPLSQEEVREVQTLVVNIDIDENKGACV